VTYALQGKSIEYGARVSKKAAPSEIITSNLENEISKKDLDKLPQKYPIFIHNHPHGSSFSSNDIMMLLKGKAQKLYIGKKNIGFESLECLDPKLAKSKKRDMMRRFRLFEEYTLSEALLKKIARECKMIYSVVNWKDIKK
jgi:hypothetical protein